MSNRTLQSIDPQKLKRLLSQIIKNNVALGKEGRITTTVNCSGKHGIGKSSIARQAAEEAGFRYIHLPTAQLEPEDLLGFPVVQFEMTSPDGKDSLWIADKAVETFLKNGYKPTGKNNQTYSIPSWLGDLSDEQPVVLCCDDFSRAAQPVQQAIMEITLSGSYSSWALPAGSTVILTSNPGDDMDYMVTQLDAAQQDRYASYEVVFNKEAWAEYAEGKIDSRIINFVLFYPEIVTHTHEDGKVTIVNSPRAIESFANSIRHLPNFSDKENLSYLMLLGHGFLNPSTVNMFTTFVNNRLDLLPDVDDLFNGNEKRFLKECDTVINEKGNRRQDIAAVLSLRVINRCQMMSRDGHKLTKDEGKALEEFFMNDSFGLDNRHNALSTIAVLNGFEKLMIADAVTKILNDDDL